MKVAIASPCPQNKEGDKMMIRKNQNPSKTRATCAAAMATAALAMTTMLGARPATAIVGGLCAPTPRVDVCNEASSSSLTMKGGPGDPNSKAKWKWSGVIASTGFFGLPASQTNYVVCLYDGDLLVSESYLPANGSLWDTYDWGFKYLDKEATSDGIQKIKLDSSKGMLQLQGKGAALQVPVPDLSFSGVPVTLQLNNVLGYEPGSNCWSATYPVTGQKPNINSFIGKCSVSSGNLCDL